MSPLRSPGPSTVSSHSGRWPGQRFSKNELPSTPSGNRRSVTPRSARCGHHHRGDAGVVVDDLGLGGAGLGVEHLVEVRQGEPPPLDLDRRARHGRTSPSARRVRPTCGGGPPVDLAAFVALVAFDGLRRLRRLRRVALVAFEPRRSRTPSRLVVLVLVLAAESSPTALAVGCRVRAFLASRTLASSAAMRSTTLSSATGVGGGHDLLAGGLAVDQVEHPVAVVVLELARARTARSATRRAATPS